MLSFRRLTARATSDLRPGARHWRESVVALKATHAVNRLMYGMPDRYGHLSRQIQQHGCRKIMEIGVWDGEHARLMIQAALKQARPEEIAYYGFDLFDDADQGTLAQENSKAPPSMASVWAKLEPFQRQGVAIHLYQGNTVELLPELAAGLPTMDFIFVDGGHSFETVSSDWKWASRLMHPKTLVVFDDYVDRETIRHTTTRVNQVVDGLDRRSYSVTPLRPVDVYPKPWGLLKIRFVKVTRRAR